MTIETLLVKKWSINSGGDTGQGLGYSDFVIIGAFSCYNRVPLIFGSGLCVANGPRRRLGGYDYSGILSYWEVGPVTNH
jgi:hypothetical protein